MHAGLVRWLPAEERDRTGLPATLRYVGIGRFLDDIRGEDVWSIVLEFDVPPPEQGSDVSRATVRFLVEDAPHDRLRHGVRFSLYEGNAKVADVEVLD